MALPKTFLLESIIRLSILHYNYEHIVDFSERVNNSDYFYDNLIGNSDGLLNEIPEDIKPIFDIIATVYCGWIDKMKNIEIIEDKTLELTFRINDESHGVCNALRHILMQDDDVEYAVYNIDHPLTGKPEMTIKTKRGKRPRSVLKKAAEELKSRIYKYGEDVLGNTKGFANMYIGTIHGFCLKMLQEHIVQFQKFTVLDEIKTKLYIEKNYNF